MLRSEFAYHLPEDLIARYPCERRSDSRLLHLEGRSGAIRDRKFTDLPDLLRRGDLLVFNDTRVLPARLHGVKDGSGGRVELLLERSLDAYRILAQIRASKSPRPGSRLTLTGGHRALVTGKRGEFWELHFEDEALGVFERVGEIPLPPYLQRAAEPLDRERYQTIYARVPGAVAAPTAGLHFDDAVLERLAAAGVASAHLTLHVGAGTFQPVRVEDLETHRMHAERTSVSEALCAEIERTRERGGRVVAVGTTCVRALESAAASGALAPFEGETRLFIRPGYRFRVVDVLLTNFHLPESSLLMLVCAFAGPAQVLEAYRHAVTGRYRFFSYGDAMFVEPDPASLAPRRPA
jgi:S-adenosylmethionine:tRNA ribosyltransferase-isomerase